jgi:hypothetical protein
VSLRTAAGLKRGQGEAEGHRHRPEDSGHQCGLCEDLTRVGGGEMIP